MLQRPAALFLIGLLLTLVPACETPEPEAEAPDEPVETEEPDEPDTPDGHPGVSLDELVQSGLTTAPGEDRPPVLERLRPPLREETEPRENRHVPNQIDTVRTLHYDGLAYELYEVSDGERVLPMSLTVTDEQYETQEGLRVGLSREDVEQLLGSPDEQEDGAYIYNLDTAPEAPVEGPPAPLTIRFENDQVHELHWSFYVD